MLGGWGYHPIELENGIAGHANAEIMLGDNGLISLVALTEDSVISASGERNLGGTFVADWAALIMMNTGYGTFPMTLSYDPDIAGTPGEIRLLPIYPQPFSGGARIEAVLDRSSRVSMTIFNLLGQEVYSVAAGQPSRRVAYWWNGANNNGADVASGCYIVRLDAEGLKTYSRLIKL